MVFDILITLFFQINFYNLESFNLNQSISIPCSTVFSLAINTRSSAYFAVRSTCPHVLKSPKLSRASLVRHSLCQCKIDDKQISFSELSSSLHTQGVCLVQSYFNSLQSMPVSFRNCIHFIPVFPAKYFLSVYEASTPISMPKVCSDTVFQNILFIYMNLIQIFFFFF